MNSFFRDWFIWKTERQRGKERSEREGEARKGRERRSGGERERKRFFIHWSAPQMAATARMCQAKRLELPLSPLCDWQVQEHVSHLLPLPRTY